MNNNRGNNRRRGRGGNRQQGNQQTNRIDSRARGNAPQLLEKYKKLAHDAHLNGDRVQEEYYLQFADHYFRVLADQKQRQEEAREKRREERGQDDDGSGERRNADRNEAQESARDNASEDSGSDGQRDVFEPAENPFVRDSRPSGQAKPRRNSRRKQSDSDDDGEQKAEQTEQDNFDASVLPPAIGTQDESNASEEKAEAPKPKRRTRRRPDSDSGEALEAVS